MSSAKPADQPEKVSGVIQGQMYSELGSNHIPHHPRVHAAASNRIRDSDYSDGIQQNRTGFAMRAILVPDVAINWGADNGPHQGLDTQGVS